MNLKIGGNSVGKIMYNGQEFGGATKLEPGTILYMTEDNEFQKGFENAHLSSTTKNWSNINGINVRTYGSDFNFRGGLDIVDDDFKNLDTEKKYTIGGYHITVSRSIVDGEYRLNASADLNRVIVIKAI